MLEVINPLPDPSTRVAEFASWLLAHIETTPMLLDPQAHPIQKALKAYQQITSIERTLQDHLDFIRGILAADSIKLNDFVENPVFANGHSQQDRGVPNGIYDQEGILQTDFKEIHPLPVLRAELKKFYEGMHADMATLSAVAQPLTAEQSLIQNWMKDYALCKTTKDEDLPQAPVQQNTDQRKMILQYFGALSSGMALMSLQLSASNKGDYSDDNEQDKADKGWGTDEFVSLACFVAPIIITAGLRGELPFQSTVTRGVQNLYSNLRNAVVRRANPAPNEIPLLERAQDPRGPNNV